MDNMTEESTRTYLCIFEPNGFIRQVVYDPSQEYIDHCIEVGHAFRVVDGECPVDVHNTRWFDGNDIVPRPTMAAIVGGAGRTVHIKDVPEGSQVFVIVDGSEILIDDYEIEVDEPGTIGFRIVPPFPMQKEEFDVEIE